MPYVGDQLGFYQALHDGGPATSAELAARAGTNERATREWLEQQATAGFLACGNSEQNAAERRYVLPDGYAALLVERDSPSFVPPMAQITAGTVAPLSRLLAAFRADGACPTPTTATICMPDKRG